MKSYLGIIWNAGDRKQAASAKSLQIEVDRSVDEIVGKVEGSGFAVYDLSKGRASPSITTIKDHKGISIGAVFGTFFERSDRSCASKKVIEIRGPQSDTILESNGSSIVRDYWGAYVAFIPGLTLSWVTADPTSSLPCYYTRFRGLTVVFSHFEKCAFFRSADFSINYSFVKKLLLYDKILTGETGINEINELLGGQRLRVAGSSFKTEIIWDPRKFAKDVLLIPVKDKAQLLRETTQSVIAAHTLSCDGVTISLSGGLDSTIVTACAVRAGGKSRINAIHHIADSGDPSELHYAKEVAEHFGIELITLKVETNESFPDIDTHPLSVRPNRSFTGHNRLVSQADDEGNFRQALFTGQGGDHLFLQRRDLPYFTDFLKSPRWRLSLSRALLNAARLSGKSVWGILGETLTYSVGLGKLTSFAAEIDARDQIVGNTEFEARLLDDLPEWIKSPQGIPPTKFYQVSSLLHMYQVREVLDRSRQRDIVHPLVSQPLIELCLRIPAFDLCYNGISRGLVRFAFDQWLPTSITTRMSKGSVSRFAIDRIAVNRNAIISALLDGELVRAGLLSREHIESFVQSDRYKVTKFGRMVLVHYAIEAWLRAWRRYQGSFSASSQGVGR